MEQMTLFEFVKPIEPKDVADGLRKHCAKWDYDWIDKLQGDCTERNFFKHFCKFTRTYFIVHNEIHYSTYFDKTGTVTMKRIGKDFEKRDFDAVMELKDILVWLKGE